METPTSQPHCLPNWEYPISHLPYRKANLNLISWSINIGTPQFPKDDKNISPRKRPESISTRPCRHCGSRKHRDNEYRHSQKGEKLARVNFVHHKDNDVQAQENYDNLFYEQDSDIEEESNQRDFHRPLQCSDLPNQPNNTSSEKLEDTSSLEGTEGLKQPLGIRITQSSDSGPSNALATLSEASFSSRDLSSTSKIPLNRNSQRRPARDITKVHHLISKDPSISKQIV